MPSAADNKNKSFLATGELAYGCTDLTIAQPHGGTGLGLVGDVEFAPPAGFVRIPASEKNSTAAILYVGGDAILGVSLEGWDDTAANGVLSPLFPAVKTTNARTVLVWPGDAADGIQEGEKLVPLGVVVFTPTNPVHPAVILYNAVVNLELSARMRLSSIRVLSVPLVLTGLPDSTGRVAAMGRIQDLPAP